MTTKDQEREALEKIRKIVAEFGEDSCIGTAFAGCFKIAAENIEKGWFCSLQERCEIAEREAYEAQKRIVHLQDQLAESEKDYQAAHEAAHIVAEQKDAEIEKLKARIQELLADEKHGYEYITEQSTRLGDLQRRAEAAEAEVIKLKAKLYDYMIAQA